MNKSFNALFQSTWPHFLLMGCVVRTIVLVLLNICDFLIVMEIIFIRESLITLVVCSYNNYRIVQTK